MMSMYPPGVTGNEYEIAGAHEWVAPAKAGTVCEDDDCTWVATLLELVDHAAHPDRGHWIYCPRCQTQIEVAPLPDVDVEYETALRRDPNGGEGWA